MLKETECFHEYLKDFKLEIFDNINKQIIKKEINNQVFPVYINEFWTAKQRQANAIHEISYRACFKPQLPRFFIELLSKEKDIIYDPFSGRGTTIVEGTILGRNIIINDINPLSKILIEPRLYPPKFNQIKDRLDSIKFSKNMKADIDLSMFYHCETESEIVSLRNYLIEKSNKNEEDLIDKWIRMVATNRLTGHSKGFFSVYSLPPNQAISQARQKKINEKRNQKPEYRPIKELILKKSRILLRDIDEELRNRMKIIYDKAQFYSLDARSTKYIKNSSIKLIITSPPFLDVVQYAKDNWLRCWFNNIDLDYVNSKITVLKNIDDWSNFIEKVFKEFFRILKPDGYIVFEVGEVRNGKINLEDYVIPMAINNGFNVEAVLLNTQDFTKTANIWGINNNKRGTNTNRIIIFNRRI